MTTNAKCITPILCLAVVLTGCTPAGAPVDSPSAIPANLFPGIIHTAAMTPLAEPPPGQGSPAPIIERITDDGGRLLGYSVRMQVVSRSGPFKILVILDDALCVKHADVLEYRAQRGRQVRLPAFTRQFAGRCHDDPIRSGQDIHAATGATLSCDAMTKGVRAALDAVKEYR
ncbi:MAG: FMN-binding protein [Phycisphaerae bacterium]|nr:FMN-binding protein [Phycisphaerae bacterium]